MLKIIIFKYFLQKVLLTPKTGYRPWAGVVETKIENSRSPMQTQNSGPRAFVNKRKTIFEIVDIFRVVDVFVVVIVVVVCRGRIRE